MGKKLNLGCGEFKKEGYVNVDVNPLVKPDRLHDLDILPYPFSDGEFDLIEADHVLEHLNNVFAVMKELHRIANDGGEVIIRVPHFSRGFTHPEHKRGFDITFPYYFDPRFLGGFQGYEFKLKKMRLNWFAQPYLKKTVLPKAVYFIGNLTGVILNFLASMSPMLCSRIWCFLVGGFEEIEYTFIAVK